MPGSYEHYFLGDFHFFVIGHPTNKVKRLIRKICSKKNATVSIGGDVIDGMQLQDPRFKLGQYSGKFERAEAQVHEAVKVLEPLTGRVKWVLHGNHELRVWNIMDVAKKIARQLQCTCYEEDLTYNDKVHSVMQIKADFGSCRVLNGHWEWYVNSWANDDYICYENERRSLKKRLCKVGGVDDCEVAVAHHIHKIHAIPPSSPQFMKTVSKHERLKAVYPTPTKKWIDQKRGLYYYDRDDRWYGSSGGFMPSYVEGFSTYAERKGYKPTEMGCVKMVVKNDKLVGLEGVIM